MKTDSIILINMAWCGIIDEKPLYEELASKALTRYVVFQVEPPEQSPFTRSG